MLERFPTKCGCVPNILYWYWKILFVNTWLWAALTTLSWLRNYGVCSWTTCSGRPKCQTMQIPFAFVIAVCSMSETPWNSLRNLMSVQRILLRIRCDNGDALRVKTRPLGEYFRDRGVGVQLGSLKKLNACLFLDLRTSHNKETDSVIDKKHI